MRGFSLLEGVIASVSKIALSETCVLFQVAPPPDRSPPQVKNEMKWIYYEVLKLNIKPGYEQRIAINTAVAHFETHFLFCL